MANSFDITAPTNEVILDAERRGNISFTVRNRIGTDVEARATNVPTPPASADWISIVGSRTRSFAVNGVQRFALEVDVPAGTPEGTYIFRMDVASVALPEEDYAEGPATSFFVPASEAPPPPPPPPEPRGYLATLSGALAGGSVLATVLALLAWLLSRSAREGGDAVENIVGIFVSALLAFFFTLVGFWWGAVIGSWLALKIKRYHSQISTPLILGGLLFVTGGLMLGLMFAVGDGLGSVGGALLFVVTMTLAVSAASFGARAIMVLKRTGHV